MFVVNLMDWIELGGMLVCLVGVGLMVRLSLRVRVRLEGMRSLCFYG